MRQANENFSRDPLILSCHYDPREDFYNAGFNEYGVQWSYDSKSSLKALENFIDGVGTYTDVKFPVREILQSDPAVTVKYDEKSFASLARTSSERNKAPEVLLKELLQVTRVHIERL